MTPLNDQGALYKWVMVSYCILFGEGIMVTVIGLVLFFTNVL
jgi:hypothetical protein